MWPHTTSKDVLGYDRRFSNICLNIPTSSYNVSGRHVKSWPSHQSLPNMST